MPVEIPDNVRRFVLTSIPSVPHLEALLLLRSGSGKAWTAPELARRLYVPEARATGILRDFEQAGLVATEGNAGVRYAPTSDAEAVIGDLAEAYSKHLVAITDLIHSADRRAIKFADAFRLNKEGN